LNLPALRPLTGLILVLGVSACGDTATLPLSAGFGPSPQLPPPHATFFPTVNIASASGWSGSQTPVAAAGFRVDAIASGLEHPRWIYVLPNGDILVAETNAPPKPEDGKGIRGWAMRLLMGRAGADGPSANRISLLRYTDGGVTRSTFLDGLNSPFGLALIGNDLYVADTDALLRFPYRSGETRITDPGVKVIDLPAGPINHHWTKNVVASPDGRHLFVSVGSNSNAGENGVAVEAGRASIWEIDPVSGSHRIFASGLRNPVGMSWEPATNALWTVVNERDEIGSDLVPDYMTSVKDGAFYGWPYSYYGDHVDERVKPERPDLVAKAIAPDYALGAHTASLGLTFSPDDGRKPGFPAGAYVGQHGSWNRRPHSGYKVVFVPFRNGHPTGPPTDVLTGFLSADEHALGRPVGVAFDRRGGLLVADDVGNRIWRISPATQSASAE
jgi:glucose/arabinose dehydrogenase